MDHPSEAVSGEGNSEVIDQQIENETSASTVTGNDQVCLVGESRARSAFMGFFL